MDRRIAIQSRRRAAIGAVAALVLVALVPSAAVAANRAGEVLSVRGHVIADRADTPPRRLARGDPVYAGDTIETGRAGRVQLRFHDGGLVDLEPSSRFRIGEYRGEQGSGSVILSFLRGALRTITGAIGYDRGETYRMHTRVATIGVRGTAYALDYCDTACAASEGEMGLYGRVGSGAIVIEGAVFTAGEYFFVPPDGGPRRIVAPPEGILDGGGELLAPGFNAGEDTILDDPDGVTDDPGALLDDAGGLLNDAGGLLNDAGGLLNDAGGLLNDAGGLLDDAGGLLNDAGGLLDDAGGMKDGSGGLLGDPGGLLDDPGGLLGDPGSLLGDPGGLLGDPGGMKDGSGGLLGDPGS